MFSFMQSMTVRIVATIAVELLLIWRCSLVSASPLDCETMKAGDARHMCRALATGKKLYCENIKDPQMRAECRARTK